MFGHAKILRMLNLDQHICKYTCIIKIVFILVIYHSQILGQSRGKILQAFCGAVYCRALLLLLRLMVRHTGFVEEVKIALSDQAH